MLNIDGTELEVTEHQIKVGKFINHGINGYNIDIHLEFNNNKKQGYLNLDAGFEKNNDIINFINKEYIGIPFDNDNQFIFFEIFDTEKFLDTDIESKIILKIKNIVDNKVMVNFEVNDELISINFEGYLNITD